LKKVLLVVATALGIIVLSLGLLVVARIISSLFNDGWLLLPEAFERCELLIMGLDIIVTALFSYLVYKVNRKLTDISEKDQTSKIKESAYQIYYCLTYNIVSLIRQRKYREILKSKLLEEKGEKHNLEETEINYAVSFKIREDYINHIANLSKRLPDELMHELYDIFFELSFIASVKSDNKSNVENLFGKFLFDQDIEAITEENYKSYYKPKLSLIINEISEIVNMPV
jgi:hypothetical protein